ncbi:hypothetical protein ACFC1T_09550 [Kitasatospora sp. NPDC056076]|uniref:hypothetical protein n=1 Tax=Kitasatospora sp. NPDC056076 TaxID=3345703 RepID=UPI0035DABB89
MRTFLRAVTGTTAALVLALTAAPAAFAGDVNTNQSGTGNTQVTYVVNTDNVYAVPVPVLLPWPPLRVL